MARQVQFPGKKILSLGLSILCMVACEHGGQPHKVSVEIPALYARHADGFLHNKEGKTYYKDHLFSGWLYELYSSSDTAVKVSFYEGKEQGIARQWYPNGQLKEVRFYDIGNKVGEHKGWWENGKQSFVYHFEEGFYEGNQKEWNEAGLLYKNSNYKKGKEDGLQQMWRYDGKMVANYVVKEGRNYGLTGVKNCKSVWEDENKN